jgi:dihydrofolate reductase
MEAIAAINKLGYLGKDGQLMWHCKEDLKWFKQVTMGKKCLVGRKTYEALPDLPGRELIVVGTGYNTLEEALALKPDIVIGGGQIYRATINMIDKIHLSIIDDDQVGDVKLCDIPMNVRLNVKRFKKD